MTNKPFNLNLKINNLIVGGNPNNILSMIDNIHTNNNYIIPHNKYLSNSDTDNSLNKIIFKFDHTINNKIYKNSQFLGKGGITAVFGIKLHKNNIDNIDNITKHLENKNLILRIQQEHNFCLDEFIENWQDHKKIFDENIIDIYFYGNIFNHNNEYLGKYIITRKYYNDEYIDNLNLSNTLNYFNSMCNFLTKLKNNNYYYRDFKFSNIGMDIIDNKLIFIVLDYDNITLLNDNSIFLLKKENKYCDKYCSGTFMPYYMAFNFVNKNINWKNELDKMYTCGFINVIMSLFYIDDEYSDKIIHMIYLKYNNNIDDIKNYDNFMIKYNTDLNKLKLYIDKLQPKFKELSESKNNIIKTILLNLISKKYSQIYDIEHIKFLMDNISSVTNNNSVTNNSFVNNSANNNSNGNCDPNNNYCNQTIKTDVTFISNDTTEKNNLNDEFKKKYIKYKQKYINLKNNFYKI